MSGVPITFLLFLVGVGIVYLLHKLKLLTFTQFTYAVIGLLGLYLGVLAYDFTKSIFIALAGGILFLAMLALLFIPAFRTRNRGKKNDA